MNSKFGQCCSCPALNDGRFLTSYVSHRDYNASIMREINVNNSHEYREALQSHGRDVLSAVIAENEKRYTCKGSQFNRVVDIDGYFNAKLKEELSKKA